MNFENFSGLREQKKLACYMNIFSAARDLFEAKGYYETSVSDIAKAAHVSNATVFNYFPSKPDMLEALYHSKLLDFLTIREQEFESPLEELWTLQESYLEGMTRYPRLSLQIMEFRAFNRFDPTITTDLWKQVDEVLQQAKDKGELRQEADLTLIRKLFFSISYGEVVSDTTAEECRTMFRKVLEEYMVQPA